jgi:hypothetical protein
VIAGQLLVLCANPQGADGESAAVALFLLERHRQAWESPTSRLAADERKKVIRAPQTQTLDEWVQTFASPDALIQEQIATEEYKRQLEQAQADPDGKPH